MHVCSPKHVMRRKSDALYPARQACDFEQFIMTGGMPCAPPRIHLNAGGRPDSQEFYEKRWENRRRRRRRIGAAAAIERSNPGRECRRSRTENCPCHRRRRRHFGRRSCRRYRRWLRRQRRQPWRTRWSPKPEPTLPPAEVRRRPTGTRSVAASAARSASAKMTRPVCPALRPEFVPGVEVGRTNMARRTRQFDPSREGGRRKLSRA